MSNAQSIFARQPVDSGSFGIRIWQESIGWIHLDAYWQGNTLIISRSTYTCFPVGAEIDPERAQCRQGQFGVWEYCR